MAAGLALSWLASSLAVVSYRPLEEAARLGIVSATLLSGYPKHQETFTYLIFCAITVPVTVLFYRWGKGACRKNQAVPFVDAAPAPRRTVWPFDYLLVAAVLFLVTFDPAVIRGSFNPYLFLSEEGTHASTLQALLNGKVLYKDVYFLYGPLMEYPLTWIARVAGAGLLTIRLYTYACSLLGFWLIYLLSRRLLERRLSRLLTLALFVLFYFPVFPAPNGTFLRVALGLSCLIPLNSFFTTGRGVYLRLAGLLCGASVFFSPEAGMAALVSALISLGAYAALPRKGGKGGFAPAAAQFIFAACCVALPIAAYFQAHDALGVFVANSLAYPRYVIMGFACLPYPDIVKDFSVATLFLYYWPVACYLGIASYLCIRWMCRRFTRRDLLLLGLTAFSMLLYRVALGRSNAEKQLWCLPALLLMAAGFCEDAVLRFRKERRQAGARPFRRLALCALFLAGIAAFAWGPARNPVKQCLRSLLGLSGDNAAAVPLGLPGAESIRVPRKDAETIRAVTAYVRGHTSPGDTVYCFPEEGMYNFLTGRMNPTRFTLAYLMATTDHRREAVADMERLKPAYVIYTLDSWRIDGMAEAVAAPEISAYIKTHYVPEKEFPGVTILKRR